MPCLILNRHLGVHTQNNAGPDDVALGLTGNVVPIASIPAHRDRVRTTFPRPVDLANSCVTNNGVLLKRTRIARRILFLRQNALV